MDAMLSHIFPLLVSMHNVTICLEKILEKAQFESLALIHLNTTVDIADYIYAQLANDTEYAWMRFNMDNKATLDNDLMENNLLRNIFFVYVLDDILDWQLVYEFIAFTKFKQWENQIYIVNQYPTLQSLIRVGLSTFLNQFYNSGVLLWNSSGHGTGIEAYTFNGFRKAYNIKIPVVNDQCSNNIYDQIFFDKTLNFYGSNLSIYGQTEPPKIVKTMTLVNEQYEHSIGGHDVLIIEAISKHLNASAKFNLISLILYITDAGYNLQGEKPENNVEQKIFNVSQLVRFDWKIANEDDHYQVYIHSGIDLNSQQPNYHQYIQTRRLKGYIFLYPHDTDNFIVVVPKRLKSKTDYVQLLKSALILVWAPVTIAATIVRFVFNKVMKTDKNPIDIYLETFGLSMGMSFNAARASAAENLLLLWFSLGTMLSGMLLSSSMFQGFALQTDIPTINNLKELEMSGLEIQLPLYIESVRNFFDNIPFELKLKDNHEFDVSEMIANGNTSYAYVVREGKFNILLRDDNIWHVVERFGAGHLSFKLHFYSSIEDRMNDLVQRCVDHGIVRYLVEKNKRLLIGSRSANQKVTSTTTVNSVSISDIRDAFLLYALGIVLSLVYFIAEGIYFWKTSQRKKK